jgi:hypothetical protein
VKVLRRGSPPYAELRLSNGYVAEFNVAGIPLVREWTRWDRHVDGYAYGEKWVRANGKLTRIRMFLHTLMYQELVGSVPSGYTIDHINRDKSDNRTSNLRLADRAQQQWNTDMRSNNTSGYSNVYWDKVKSNWYGRIMVRGKFHYTPYGDDPAKVALEVEALKKRLRGDFA